jgi:hypothetical protein
LVSAKPAAKRVFWVGTFDAAPVWNIDIGGVTFQRFTNGLALNPSRPDVLEQTAAREGKVEELTSAQITRVLEAAYWGVVRWINKQKKQGIILSKKRRPFANGRDDQDGFIGQPYEPQEGDEPLSQFVYLEPLNETNAIARERTGGKEGNRPLQSIIDAKKTKEVYGVDMPPPRAR